MRRVWRQCGIACTWHPSQLVGYGVRKWTPGQSARYLLSRPPSFVGLVVWRRAKPSHRAVGIDVVRCQTCARFNMRNNSTQMLIMGREVKR
jgi:hypothetical protein